MDSKNLSLIQNDSQSDFTIFKVNNNSLKSRSIEFIKRTRVKDRFGEKWRQKFQSYFKDFRFKLS